MKGFVSQKIVAILISGFLSIIIALSLVGCGENLFKGLADDDSYAASIEAARIALDKGNWAEAIDILAGMDQNDATVKELKSQAFAGKVGINTFNLLQTIDNLSKKGNIGGIDMVGTMLGGDNQTLTYTKITQKINDLTNAINTLTSIGTLTDEQRIQLGLLSLSRATLTIALIISEDKNKKDVTLTDEGIEGEYTTTPDFSDVENINDKLNTLLDDIGNIASSIDAITKTTGQTTGNDLSDNFNQFKDKLAGSDNKVTLEELQNYAF